ncbi:MAG TPA: Gfo/Idh/MocA family oxidoreductase [Phycisphaerae bacterium]|nr:Gfo/Idh/MocA family oxidoreductase [Phycisphaerae bacterium]HNU44265.1 Gfo/Idh/MocA family oxidoreductase [Phycisphaerae bacterium]
MSESTISRRTLLRTAASAAAFAMMPARVFSAAQGQAPSEKLNIAGIGIGGMGQVNLANLTTENIVALCDVDPNYAANVFSTYPGARAWTDYREMLEKQKDIDAVVIATPDHTHAVIAMAAIQAGKHVYLQKPLTHDIYEARALAKAARQAKVITQMGIQGHSEEGVRLICEWLADGAIGEVREVDVWCNDSYYPWGHAGWSPASCERPKDTPPLPSGMNWDLWIGPAPFRPYHPGYHPQAWRAWWDFGSGWMADRGAHQIDPAFWALKLGLPISVEATALGQTDETHAIAAIVTFRFPSRGSLPPVKLTWYEGVRAPRPEELEQGRMMGDSDGGALFKGTKGMLMCGVYGNSPRLIPESRMAEYRRPEKTIPRVDGGHEQDWVRACKEGRPAGADFEYSAVLTEICLLGVIAKRMNARLEWDAGNMQVSNLPDANKYVRLPYREGWSL